MYCFFGTYANFCAFLYDFFAYFGIFYYLCSVKTQIMAIGNVTPDSFYAASRLLHPSSGKGVGEAVVAWAQKALKDGADILDIGACSTRPGSTPVDETEEWRRLEPALIALRDAFPQIQLSLDTFRPEIARRALDQFGPMMINDISGGCEEMYQLVQARDVPYVFTLRGRYNMLRILDHSPGLNVVIDLGLGFCGGVEQDYECLRNMDQLRAYHRPILVGISRKSMVYKPLGLTPETCLTATQALHLYAIEHGATILRTHDVKETKQIIDICNSYLFPSASKIS